MDNSYADFIISKYSKFLDPFSITEINTERICYPVSYANEDLFRSFTVSKNPDLEDDLLVKQSQLKDLPDFEKLSIPQTYIADGAAHILRNRSRESFIQLLGMPRIGKSTLLKKIALLSAQDMKTDPSSPVPLLVNLELLSKSEINSKMELIEACFSQNEEFEAYLRQNFFQGRVILLLDEVDSLPSLNSKLAEWLLALKTYTKLPLLVLASRYSGYQQIEVGKVLYIDIYPLKLQISMAQNMLSELQFERLVEVMTGPSSQFCEFASTPFLFSLLLEMFRWGLVGTGEAEKRGSLYHLACKQLIGHDFKYTQAFEVIANDMMMRNSKQFSFADVKNCGLDHLWNEVQSSQIVLLSKSIENSEEESAEQVFEKELKLNSQIARKNLPKKTGEVYRFLHLRILEVLNAQFYLNAVEDSLLHASSGFLMESSAYQRTFNSCFPVNFLYCKRFREVLLFFSVLCSESIFENLVKYLLGKESYECCIISEKLLRERGVNLSYRPLINKVKQDKLEHSKKMFAKGFAHPSRAVQRLTRQEAVESGLSEQDLSLIVKKNIEFVLKNTHWVYAKHISLGDLDLKVLKSVFLKLVEVSQEVLSNLTKTNTYKVVVHKAYLSLFVSCFEKDAQVSPNSNPVNPCATPNKAENALNTEESTFKIGFDRFKFYKNESSIIDKLPNTSKLVTLIIDLIQICPSIDVTLSVKALLILNCSMAQIHISLAARFACLEDCYERKEVLKTLRLLGFVTQHTVDLPLISLSLNADLFFLAKDIIKLLNYEKLKKYAINVLVKEDSTQVKILLALRALAFINKLELDNEVFYLLVQFIDHYSLELRLEAIKSLYAIVKNLKIIDNIEIRKNLAVVPHVLRDRIKLIKYDSKLKSQSIKCLTALWACLDKGKEDSYATQMFHILVKEQLGSSFLVGNFSQIFSIVKDSLSKSLEEKQSAWVSLRKMSPILDYIEETDRKFILKETENSLKFFSASEMKKVLKLLLNNNLFPSERSRVIELVFASSFHTIPGVTKYFSIFLMKWHQISFIKALIPASPGISLELTELLSKLRVLIDSLFEQVDLHGHESFFEVKQLHNYYKTFVNQIAENLQFPAKLALHKKQLLDISADLSFVNHSPELSASFADFDGSFPKKPAGAETEENPPPIKLLQELLLAGIRSEGLNHWVLFYLKKSESIEDLLLAGESWKILSSGKEFFNSHVEALLLKFSTHSPDEVLKVVVDSLFKSDSFCVQIIGSMIKGDIKSELAARAVCSCIEMKSPLPLEETVKLINFNSSDTRRMFYLNSSGFNIVENLEIFNEMQLNSVLKALVSTGCSLFVQIVWSYIMKMLSQSPSYLLNIHAVNVLENCNSWDCKFLLVRARIMGLMPVEQVSKETGSSMSTKKI